jgi:hypothetical protein
MNERMGGMARGGGCRLLAAAARCRSDDRQLADRGRVEDRERRRCHGLGLARLQRRRAGVAIAVAVAAFYAGARAGTPLRARGLAADARRLGVGGDSGGSEVDLEAGGLKLAVEDELDELELEAEDELELTL